jgi:hypothetical protein
MINWKDNTIILAIIFAVYTSSHVVFVDILGLRMELQALMIIFTSATILTYLIRGNIDLNGDGFYIILLLVAALLISEVLFRGRTEKIAGFILSGVLIFTVLASEKYKIIKTLDVLNNINSVIAFIAIIGLVISFFIPSVFDAILARPVYYNNDFPSGAELFSLLGHADGFNTIFEQKILRVSGYVNQKSLVAAYFLLPLSLGLIFSKVRPLSIFILSIFILLSSGATTYISIIFAIFVFVFRNYISKTLFIFFPFLFLGIFLIVLAYYFYDLYDINRIKEIMDSFVNMSDDDSPIYNRFQSGLARLLLIGFQFIEFLNVFPLPSGEKILTYTFGSNVMTNALRGGVVGLLLTVALYYKIFRLISLELTNVENKSKANQCGLALMYALIFQSMVFSDFGFSTYYGFVMFSIALLLFKKRNGRLFSGKAQANA